MRGVLLYTFFLLSAYYSEAQTHHYWTEQFGTTSSFLGGATFAGSNDNSTVYYNPAAMGRVEVPTLSININAYRLRHTNVDNALGEGNSVKETRFITIPNLIAGIMPLNEGGKFSLGYALLTKKTYNSKFDLLKNSQQDIIADQPGLENHIAAFELQHRVFAFSAGIAGSYNINEQWSVGLSHFFDFQSVNYAHNLSMRTVPEAYAPENLVEVQSEIDLEYWNVSGSASVGVHYTRPNIKVGVVWRVPSYNIVGKAKNYRELTVSNLPFTGLDSSFSIVDQKSNLQVKEKNFGSIGWGVQWQMNAKLLINFSQELFIGHKSKPLYEANGDVQKYPTSISEADVDALVGTQHFLAYEPAKSWVLNTGLGIQVKATERLDLFFAARTDFSYKKNEIYDFNEIVMVDGNYDLMHFTFGTSYLNYNDKRYDIGVEVGTSISGKKSNWANINDPQLNNYLLSAQEKNTKYKIFMLRLVVGIALDFNKKK